MPGPHDRGGGHGDTAVPAAAGSSAAANAALDPALARKRRLKHFAARLPFRPTLRFFYHYVVRAGFLDGYRGFVFCRLMAFYEFLSLTKARELSRTGRS